MQLSWSTAHAANGVVLVRCRLHNNGKTPRRGRLQSLLDGTVLPPRRRGIPLAEFDADGVDVRLAAGERRGVGFAVVLDDSPASDGASAGNSENSHTDPPVELVDVEPAATRENGSDHEHEETSPDDAVQRLGPYRPPRDAIGDSSDDSVVAGAVDATNDGSVGEHGKGNDDDGRSPVGPARVDGWLDAVERRVERGERLSNADAATAAEVLAAAGGAAALVDLDERLAGDAERLRQVGERATKLAERAEAADPPTDALERLR